MKLNPSEGTILKFKIDVSGTTSVPQPRLVIPISDKGISLVFEGVMNNGSVEVDVAQLLQLTDSTEFQGKLEVVIEDSIFVPWEENIEIESPTVVKAKAVKAPIKESTVTVSATTGKEEVKAPIMELKKKSVSDLFSEIF
jgi:hypothetical protein